MGESNLEQTAPLYDSADRSDEYRLECATLRDILPEATFNAVMLTAIDNSITPFCALDKLVKRGYRAGLLMEKIKDEMEQERKI